MLHRQFLRRLRLYLPKLPVPTISLDAQLKIVELLNTKDCVLPCYLSITPGTTTWKDAKSLLDAIGAEYTGQSQQGDMIWFGYGMHRGNATNVLNQNADSLFDLDLVVDDNGIVQQVFCLVFNAQCWTFACRLLDEKFPQKPIFTNRNARCNLLNKNRGPGLLWCTKN